MDYGLGAIFGCPAHDQRDLDFANKYNLDIIKVVKNNKEINRLQTHEKTHKGHILYKSMAFFVAYSAFKIIH